MAYVHGNCCHYIDIDNAYIDKGPSVSPGSKKPVRTLEDLHVHNNYKIVSNINLPLTFLPAS